MVRICLVGKQNVVSTFLSFKKNPQKLHGACDHPEDIFLVLQGDGEEVKEESQNAHNSKMDDSSQLQPFFEQNYVVGTKIPASAETEKDRGLGDSLPNTTNSSQISLAMSAVPSDLQFCHTNQPPSSATALQPHTLGRVAAFFVLNHFYHQNLLSLILCS